MKTTKLIMTLLVALPLLVNAQNYKSTKSYIRFFSDAPLEDIEAINKDAVSAFNASTGEIAFSIPIVGFQFEKSLMQEHFNENYLESGKYPTATFTGTVTGYDVKKSGFQKAKATGKMKIHGVEKKVTIEGEMKIDDDQLIIKSVFPITIADYDIEIPKVVFYNIAEEVEVTVNFEYEKK